VTEGLVVRPATADDREDILALLERTLGWRSDGRHQAFFAWKHEQNVFGPSTAWVAFDGDRLAGFRTFLRWEFVLNGATIRAVRAVDTATDPDSQRRGVFRLLTLHALENARAEGTTFVFNTPNDRSRPGYLKMGWRAVGRIPLVARPAAPAGFVRMAGARAPADRWSIESGAGDAAAAVLEDDKPVSELLSSQPHALGLATRRSVEYLRWRYGFGPLGYRAIVVRGDVAEGLALFRVRRRGTASEAALCEVLAPGGDRATGRRLVRDVAAAAGADYLLRVAGARDGCVSLPRQGPILTWRPLCDTLHPRRQDWNLTLGDVELF
jgi:GNAT superfamily N-acetyltransferase